MVSQTHANKLLNVTCGVSDITLPSTVYLGLCANEPAATNGAVTGEPTVDSYERKLVGGSTAHTRLFSAGAGGVITNGAEIQMKTAREAYGATMHYFFLSESASGNAILWGKINGDTGLTVGAESVPTFYEGQLKASIDVALS